MDLEWQLDDVEPAPDEDCVPVLPDTEATVDADVPTAPAPFPYSELRATIRPASTTALWPMLEQPRRVAGRRVVAVTNWIDVSGSITHDDGTRRVVDVSGEPATHMGWPGRCLTRRHPRTYLGAGSFSERRPCQEAGSRRGRAPSAVSR